MCYGSSRPRPFLDLASSLLWRSKVFHLPPPSPQAITIPSICWMCVFITRACKEEGKNSANAGKIGSYTPVGFYRISAQGYSFCFRTTFEMEFVIPAPSPHPSLTALRRPGHRRRPPSWAGAPFRGSWAGAPSSGGSHPGTCVVRTGGCAFRRGPSGKEGRETLVLVVSKSARDSNGGSGTLLPFREGFWQGRGERGESGGGDKGRRRGYD